METKHEEDYGFKKQYSQVIDTNVHLDLVWHVLKALHIISEVLISIVILIIVEVTFYAFLERFGKWLHVVEPL